MCLGGVVAASVDTLPQLLEGRILLNRFVYVDGFFSGKNDRKSKWTRIHVSEVEEKIRKPGRNYNCFATVQHFGNAIAQENESQYCDLYFDFDGPLEKCRQDVMKVVEFFTTEFDLHPETLRVYFSGMKGFHLFVSAQALGVKAHPKLSYIHKEAALWLRELLDLKTLDYKSIYSIRRMIRLPDSIHTKSGLFKIELTHSELKTKTVKAIKALAKTPRGSLYPDLEKESISVNDDAAHWFTQFIEQFDRQKMLYQLRPKRKIAKTDHVPVCVKFLLESDTVPVKGQGNQAALALATFFKDAGLSQKQALNKLVPWVTALKNTSTKHTPDKAVATLKSVVKAVYDGEYFFACAFIRAVGDKDTPIPCEYQNCKTATADNQTPRDPISLHLSEASRAEFVGQPVVMDVMVSGKDMSPYIIPKNFAIKCSPDGKYCEHCRLAQFGGYYECEFSMTDPEVLEMMRSGQDALKGTLRRKAGVKARCGRHLIEVIDYFNLEEVRLIPQIDFGFEEQEYAVRRGFYVGHGLKTNEEYRIEAITVPHPKSQYAVHIFDTVSSASSDLSFTMTPTLKRQMKVFQLRKKESVADKFDHIHRDLAANVTHIWGRELISTTIDLIYHTALSFYFQESLVQKGWGELLIIGDSGQAKSTLALEMRNHYQAGAMLNGESASRTGLVYSLQESDNRWMLAWGQIPLNDRRLLIIDEFGGVPQDQIAEMSGLRTSGIAEVTKVISAKTAARTRLIFMSNPRTGRPIAQYDYAVQAVAGKWELISKMEDVRRFDVAVCCRSGEVSEEIINRREFPTEPHVYTNSLCNLLIRWTWTRRAEDVEFSEEAVETILVSAIAAARKYHSSIPLVEAADHRLKLARLSVGCAARLFSTDVTGEKILVEKEHVEFVVALLEKCYHSLDYDTYSEAEYSASRIPDTEATEIDKEFKEFPAWFDLRRLLLSTRYFRRRELEDMMGYDTDTAKEVIRILSRHRLIEATSAGYRKREFFIKLLKEMTQEETEGGKF